MNHIAKPCSTCRIKVFWLACIFQLGKTFQALAIADFYRDDWPLLIVTTATARSAWERHIRDLLPSVSAQHISCLASTSDFVRDSKVLITSYQMMERNCDRLLQNNFGFIILVSCNCCFCLQKLHIRNLWCLQLATFHFLGWIAHSKEFQSKSYTKCHSAMWKCTAGCFIVGNTGFITSGRALLSTRFDR